MDGRTLLWWTPSDLQHVPAPATDRVFLSMTLGESNVCAISRSSDFTESPHGIADLFCANIDSVEQLFVPTYMQSLDELANCAIMNDNSFMSITGAISTTRDRKQVPASSIPTRKYQLTATFPDGCLVSTDEGVYQLANFSSQPIFPVLPTAKVTVLQTDPSANVCVLYNTSVASCRNLDIRHNVTGPYNPAPGQLFKNIHLNGQSNVCVIMASDDRVVCAASLADLSNATTSPFNTPFLMNITWSPLVGRPRIVAVQIPDIPNEPAINAMITTTETNIPALFILLKVCRHMLVLT